jgi:CheY-like chemotaxis protein
VTGPEAPDTETVLLVDDDAIGRALIAEYLRTCGYRVLEAADAGEAMQALEGHDIDIVVTEVELRGANGGFSLSTWIRTNRPDIKVILTTSVARTADTAAGLCENGPTLTKPYEAQLLVDAIRRLRGT